VQHLIDEAMRGDRGAFERLIEPHLDALYRVAAGMVGPDDAADVTQDALVSAWGALGQLTRPDRFESWLRSILMNRARNVLRTRRRHPALTFDVGAGHGAQLLHEPMNPLPGRWAMEDAMAQLDPDHRAVIVLHYVADLPLRQVAVTLGVREGTVKSRLNAALKALRRQHGEDLA
jgi:RNA polymerase sigma-70 factor, ECF subfamily